MRLQFMRTMMVKEAQDIPTITSIIITIIVLVFIFNIIYRPKPRIWFFSPFFALIGNVSLKSVKIGRIIFYINLVNKADKLIVIKLSNVDVFINRNRQKHEKIEGENRLQGDIGSRGYGDFTKKYASMIIGSKVFNKFLSNIPGVTIYFFNFKIHIGDKINNEHIYFKIEKLRFCHFVSSSVFNNFSVADDSPTSEASFKHSFDSNLFVDSLALHSKNYDPLVLSGYSIMSASYQVDSIKDFMPSNILLDVNNSGSNIKVVDILRIILPLFETNTLPKVGGQQGAKSRKGNIDIKEFLSRHKVLIQTYAKFLRRLSKINLNLSNIKIDQIYIWLFFLIDNSSKFSYVLHLLGNGNDNNDNLNFMNQNYFTMNLAKYNINLNKLNKESIGYDLMFSENDIPVQVISSVINFTFSLNSKFELFQIANINTNVKSNFFYQSIKLLDDLNYNPLSVFKLSSHISSPTLDITTVQLADLKSNYNQIRTFMKALTKNTKNSECTDTPRKSSSNQQKLPPENLIFDFLYKNISKVIPVLLLKLTIEDGLFIITHEDPDVKSSSQSIVLNTNLVVFETTSQKKYSNKEEKKLNKFSELSYIDKASKSGEKIIINTNQKTFQTSIYYKLDFSSIRIVFRKREADIGVFNNDCRFPNSDANNRLSKDLLFLDFVSFRLSLQQLPVLPKAICNVVFETLKIDLQDLMSLKGLSEILESLNYRDSAYNKIYGIVLQYFPEYVDTIKKSKSKINKLKRRIKNDYKLLFQYLPLWLTSVSFQGSNFFLSLPVRSLFIPKEELTVLEALSANEFVNGNSLKLKFQVKSVLMELINDIPHSKHSAKLLAKNLPVASQPYPNNIESGKEESFEKMENKNLNNENGNIFDSSSNFSDEKEGSRIIFWNTNFQINDLTIDVFSCDPSLFFSDDSNDPKKEDNYIMSNQIKIPIVKFNILSIQDNIIAKTDRAFDEKDNINGDDSVFDDDLVFSNNSYSKDATVFSVSSPDFSNSDSDIDNCDDKSIHGMSNNSININVEIDSITSNFSLFTCFIMLSSILLMRNTIFSFRKKARDENLASVNNDKSTTYMQNLRNSSFHSNNSYEDEYQYDAIENNILSQLLLKLVNVKINVSNSEILFHMPLGLKTKFQLQRNVIHINSKRLFMHSNISRIFLQSPRLKYFFERLILINDVKLNLDLKKLQRFFLLKKDPRFDNIDLNDEILTVASITFKTFRISIPHGTIIHKIFDNISIFVKLFKYLAKSFKSNVSDLVLKIQHVVKAPILPRFIIKGDRLLFVINDDPFESKFNGFFQIGLVEQKDRLLKLNLFVKKLKNDYRGIYDFEITSGNQLVIIILQTNQHLFYCDGWVKDDSNNGYSHDTRIFDIFNAFEVLQRNFSKSWISRIKIFKQKLAFEQQSNKEFFWMPDIIPTKKNACKFVMSDFLLGNIPLLNCMFEDICLTVSSVDFPIRELSDFLYGVGKKIPKDTVYQMMIPMNLNLKFKELRAHLRDYPIPLVYMPSSLEGDNIPISITGNIVICEVFYDTEDNINKIFVPLVPSCIKSDHDNYYSLMVPKSVQSVKTFFNLNIENLNTEKSTRICWGVSYQTALQQIMKVFDGFTKPPVDPSEKVGFWDKLRANIHGRLNWKLNGLDIIFKGSRDPYKIIDIHAGYVLSFSGDVNFDLNKKDNPSKFFSVQAGSVKWVSPDFLNEPLLVWSRKSSKSIYFANIKNVDGFHNLSHFYLSQPDGNLQKDLNVVNRRIKSFYFKTVISLGDDVNFNFGISFERDDFDSKRTDKFIPHYRVKLIHPDFVKHEEKYDSYKGFRSQYINMEFHVDSRSDVKNNTLHFSLLEIKKVIQWWKLFSGNMSVPIRQGKIFGPATESKKFSKYLNSIRYQFHLDDIFISHSLRDDGHNYTDDIQSDKTANQFHGFGIKSKVGKLMVDLYQNKQSVVIHKEILKKTQKLMKMKFNVGEINLENVDIRLIHSVFFKNEKNVNDDDINWYDYNDFDEYNLESVEDMPVKFDVHPIVYSPHVVYFKKSKIKKSDSEANHDNNEVDIENIDNFASNNEAQGEASTEVDKVSRSFFADENDIENKSSSYFCDNYEKDFTNSFIIHDMLLKWNCINRNLFFKYVHLVGISQSIINFLKEDIIGSVLESLKKKSSKKQSENDSTHSCNASLLSEKCIGADDSTFCKVKLERFDEDLRSTDNLNLFYTEDYLIKLVAPQIQFIEKTSSDACLILTSPDIEVKFISVNQKRTDVNSESGLLEYSDIVETRIGSLIHDANMFVFLQHDTSCKKYFAAIPYGSSPTNTSRINWPPFFNKDFVNRDSVSSKYMLLENTSMLLRYDKIGMLTNSTDTESESDEAYESSASSVSGINSDDEKKIKVNKIKFFAPEIIVSCNSLQYSVLHSLIFNLLLYSEPSFKNLNNKLSKLALKASSLHENSEEEEYKYLIVNKINFIKKRIAILLELNSNYNIAQKEKLYEDMESLRRHSEYVKEERDKLYSELYTTIKLVLLGGGSGKKKKQKKNKNEDGGQNILEEINWYIRSDSIIFHMLLNENEPFIDIAISNGQFERKEKSDQSTMNFLLVQMMQGFALSADRYYQDILLPYDIDSLKGQKNRKYRSKHKPLVSIRWSLKPPVGGIKVIQYIDIDLKPMKVQLDENTGKQIVGYLFKDTKISSRKNKNKKKEKKERKLSKFFGSKKDNLNEGQDINFDDISSDDDEENLINGDGENDDESCEYADNTCMTTAVSLSSPKYNDSILNGISEDNDANIMMERTNNNFSIGSFKLHALPLCVSYKGENGKQRLVSVDNFLLNLPNVIISQKILSVYDVTMFLKRVIFKLLLQHTGKLIGNKLKNRNIKKVNRHLPQLSEYNEFISIDDLQNKEKNEKQNDDAALRN